jgi:hypothetical protein
MTALTDQKRTLSELQAWRSLLELGNETGPIVQRIRAEERESRHDREST